LLDSRLTPNTGHCLWSRDNLHSTWRAPVIRGNYTATGEHLGSCEVVLDVSAVTPHYLLRSTRTTVARAADVTGTVHCSAARVPTKNVV